jgi:hypothetical protein
MCRPDCKMCVQLQDGLVSVRVYWRSDTTEGCEPQERIDSVAMCGTWGCVCEHSSACPWTSDRRRSEGSYCLHLERWRSSLWIWTLVMKALPSFETSERTPPRIWRRFCQKTVVCFFCAVHSVVQWWTPDCDVGVARQHWDRVYSSRHCSSTQKFVGLI